MHFLAPLFGRVQRNVPPVFISCFTREATFFVHILCVRICVHVCVCVKVIEPCRSAGWTQSDVRAFFQAYIEAGSRPSMLFSRSVHLVTNLYKLHSMHLGIRCKVVVKKVSYR